MEKKYYFGNDFENYLDWFEDGVCCIDMAEIKRLARDWDKTVDELMEQLHEASASEIAEYGYYDSETGELHPGRQEEE